MSLRLPQEKSMTAGFTLLEALVATALMGLILTALATITAQWLPNWNRGIVRIQRDDLTALAIERLAADLSAAEFISASRQNRKPYFVGVNRSVTFVRTALGPNAGPGLELIRIAEISGERGPTLVRTKAPFRPGIDRAPPTFTDPVVLLRPPYRLFFSYAGADRNWHDDWQEQPRLPNAVKLTIRDATTQTTLPVSTATLIHTEVPVDCIGAKSLTECLSSNLQPSADAGKPR